MVAHAQTGVANPRERAAKAAPPAVEPSRKASRNIHAAESAAGKATARIVAKYDSATRPRGDKGSPPAQRRSGLIEATAGTARRTTPGALSE